LKKVLAEVELKTPDREKWSKELGAKVEKLELVELTGDDAHKINPNAHLVKMIVAHGGGGADW
jgi:folate-dependent tRNA-U54 methylase TrmFO/GidA